MTRFLVTVAPPTPNGDLHVGHLSGPYLAADVFTRVRRMEGHEALLVSYSDDYQSYMERRAAEQGADAFALAGSNADRIAETLLLAGIDVDHFLRAGKNEHYRASITKFLEAARAQGALVQRMRDAPFCEGCALYGYEAFGRGTCRVCAASTDASQCENCANAPDVTGVDDVRCIRCKTPMASRSVERSCLDLNRYREWLRELHAGAASRPALEAFIATVLGQPDLTWPIDRPGEVGIDTPSFGRIHTWFSGLPGYHASLTEYFAHRGDIAGAERWLKDEQTRVVHFLGFDCSFSHAVVYPVLIHLMGDYTTRLSWYTNAFLKLDGEDFSTSRGHAIWIRQLLEQSSVDAARLYVARFSPEDAPRNFDRAAFVAWRADTFAWMETESVRLASELERRGERDALPAELVEPVEAIRRRWSAASSVERFSMRAMAEAVDDLCRLTTARGRDRAMGTRALLAEYARLGAPLHPGLSSRLSSALASGHANARARELAPVAGEV